MTAAGTLIMAVVGMGVNVFNKWGAKYGLEIDAHNRDAIASAAKNVAAGAIAKGLAVVGDNGKMTLPAGVLASLAKEVVEKRAPDAVAHFSLTPDDVAQRIIEQLPQVAATAAPVPAPTVTGGA